MTEPLLCSQCQAPLSPQEGDGRSCARCLTFSSSSTPGGSETVPSAARTSVNDSPPTKPAANSNFLLDVFRELAKVFDQINKAPYAWIAMAYGLYRMWKIYPHFSLGMVVATVALLLVLVFLYALIRTSIPRIRSFIASTAAQPVASTGAVSHTMDGWWLLHGGRPTGPHPLAHLMDAAEKGDFSLDALVCPVGQQQWSALGTVLPPRIPETLTSSDPPATS